MRILGFCKQVLDPEIPQASFRVDEATQRAVPPPGAPPVVNGFDEQAVEAALRVKAAHPDTTVTVMSMGSEFSMNVIKKPIAMGADEIILLQDPAFEDADAFTTAYALAMATIKAGPFDLIICGRQASDTDRGQVGVGIAEIIGMPSITLGKSVEVQGGKVVVERVLVDGIEVVEAPLPALVTVSNELGQARYPSMRGVMAASRKQPVVWKASDLEADAAMLGAGGRRVRQTRLYIPKVEKNCEYIQGENGADAGRKLALRLREDRLI